ncbi:hypothetical protein CSUI_009525, partial [Cystoisospora suis]
MSPPPSRQIRHRPSNPSAFFVNTGGESPVFTTSSSSRHFSLMQSKHSRNTHSLPLFFLLSFLRIVRPFVLFLA